MKHIMTVLKFEYLTYMKRKSFQLLTIVLVLVVAAVFSWGRISDYLSGEGVPVEPGVTGEDITGETAEAEEIPQDEKTIAFLDESGGQAGSAEYYNNAYAGSGTVFVEVSMSREELEKKVADKEYEEGLILTGPLSYVRVARSIGMYDAFSAIFDHYMLYNFQYLSLLHFGMEQAQIDSVLSVGVSSETLLTTSGKNQEQSFVYTYALIMVLYFAIMLYGQFVSSSVATEKSTRAMELLITSTKSNNLMFGKVLGTGFAGLTQLLLVLASGALFYTINKSYYADNFIMKSIFSMPASMIFYTLLFFILGFFIYAFLYAALASLVSRMEELSTAVMPVTFLFIGSFFVTMFSMGAGSVDSTLMIVCSYVPLTSPMAMFARIAMGEVQSFEILISVALLIISNIGAGMLASKIYRMGVLMYGTPPNLKNIFRILKNK